MVICSSGSYLACKPLGIIERLAIQINAVGGEMKQAAPRPRVARDRRALGRL
jgi:hypothetical protein